MTGKVVLEAECNFEDTELRKWMSQLQTKLDTINERTKVHTIQIRKLKNET